MNLKQLSSKDADLYRNSSFSQSTIHTWWNNSAFLQTSCIIKIADIMSWHMILNIPPI